MIGNYQVSLVYSQYVDNVRYICVAVFHYLPCTFTHRADMRQNPHLQDVNNQYHSVPIVIL